MSTKLATVIADFTTQLATAMAVAATTATLQSATDDDGNALPAGVYFFAIDGNNSQKEHVVCSLSGTALTNIKSISRQGVQTSGCARTHRVGSTVELTDFAHLRYINDLLSGSTALDSSNPLTYDGTASITSPNQLATKAYVDGVAIAGGANASSTIKGISKLTVDPVSSSNPLAVGDNDPRVPTANQIAALAGTSGTAPSGSNKLVDNNDTATSGANKVLRLDGSGKLPALDGSQLTNVSGVSALLQAVTAGPAITGIVPLYIGPYQSDGGVKLDAKATNTSNVTTSFTVGNNANRILVVFVAATTNGAAVNSLTYGGVAMTQVDTFGVSNGAAYTFILIAPPIGANNLIASMSAGTCDVSIYSYYNAAQTSQPEAHTASQSASTAFNVNLATVANGALVVSGVFPGGSSLTVSGNGYTYNTQTAGSTHIESGDSGQVFPAVTSINITTPSLGGILSAVLMLSLAPATAPVFAVSPAAAANISNLFYNTYASFLGFSTASASAGASLEATVGGVVTGLSGLTTGAQYYLGNSAGTIQKSAGTNSRKLGIALSSTTLLLTNIW
jgi:hypothetical protein